MLAAEVSRATAAARSIALAQGLAADEAVVLQNSNKLSLRLLPCDVLARVAPAGHDELQFEIELAQRLAEAGSPMAALDPRVEARVYERDGFLVTLWTYYESAASISSADYARALERLQAGMRGISLPTPHFTDRVEEAQRVVADHERSPALDDADRELLGTALRELRQAVTGRGRAEQLLHGEPHPGNLLATASGPRFIDLETCCRGPVEFDVAHAPEGVGEHIPGLDRGLLRDCRILVSAIVTAWRWDREDQLPDGRRLGLEGLEQLRAARDR